MIYVTPLPFNASEMSWDQVQAHLRGIGNSCHLGINTGALHSQISAISCSRLQLPSVENIANCQLRILLAIIHCGTFLLIWEL